jgi:hypothetical protein
MDGRCRGQKAQRLYRWGRTRRDDGKAKDCVEFGSEGRLSLANKLDIIVSIVKTKICVNFVNG